MSTITNTQEGARIPAESEVIRAASNAAVPPRGPRKPKTKTYIVFGGIVNGEHHDWAELGRATVTGIFDEKMRDEAEAQVTDKLPLDEQGGPFVTIAAEHWQPREYEIIEQAPIRKPKGT